MLGIEKTLKLSLFAHYLTTYGKKIIKTNKNGLHQITFYNTNNNLVGCQTKASMFNKEKENFIKKTIVSRRLFDNQFRMFYEEFIVIEQKLKHFIDSISEKKYLLPTNIKISKTTVFEKNGMKREDIVETRLANQLKPITKNGEKNLYTLDEKPVYNTTSIMNEIKPSDKQLRLLKIYSFIAKRK